MITLWLLGKFFAWLEGPKAEPVPTPVGVAIVKCVAGRKPNSYYRAGQTWGEIARR